jgi:hypothetical protein
MTLANDSGVLFHNPSFTEKEITMSKTRKSSALVSRRKSSGATKTTKKAIAANWYRSVKEWKNDPPTFEDLVQRVEAKLGGGHVARGLAFYDAGRMLNKSSPADPAKDVFRKMRFSDEAFVMGRLARNWDRAVLEKELKTPMANGTLPKINYFALLSDYFAWSSGLWESLLRQMRAENLSIKEFWVRFKAAMKIKEPRLIVRCTSACYLDVTR